MSDLRKKLIRLAHSNPELRADLLPLLKEADLGKNAASVKEARYNGLNRGQKRMLDAYLRGKNNGYKPFKDLSVYMRTSLYEKDDTWEERLREYGKPMAYAGHHQLEESVEVYLWENDTTPLHR